MSIWSNAETRFANLVRVLQQQRLNWNVTFTEISEVTDINRHSISNWEMRRQVPNTVGFIAWANSLGYDVVLIKKTP